MGTICGKPADHPHKKQVEREFTNYAVPPICSPEPRTSAYLRNRLNATTETPLKMVRALEVLVSNMRKRSTFNEKVVHIRSTSEKVNAIYDRLGGFKYDEDTEEDRTKRTLKDLQTLASGNQYYGFWNSETNLMEGKGVMIRSNGTRQDGYWKHGKMQGKSRVIFASGSIYEGWMDQSKKNGNGKYMHPDGGVYEGEWLMDMKSGRGVQTWPDGRKYVGEYLKDKQNGAGVMEWADGRKYDGQWLQGVEHGKGVFRYSDGKVYDGEWDMGKRKGKGTLSWPNGDHYEGAFANDAVSGRGIYKWHDGQQCEGDFADGKMNGAGVYKWPDGQKYTGQCVNDGFEGEGMMEWPDGRKYVGQWKQNNLHGKGSMRYADGSEYIGGFLDDKEDGDGILKKPDGKEYDVGYKNGDQLYCRIKPSSVLSHWEWKSDSGNFVAYSASDSQNIENAYLNEDMSTTLTISGNAYTIDVVNMIQTNVSNNGKRRIQRVRDPQPVAPNSSVRWMFDGDNGSCSYSPADSQNIEKVYQAESAQFTLATNGHQYVIDLLNMAQINMETGKVRKIQRNSPPASAPGCTLERLPSTSPEYGSVKTKLDVTMTGKYSNLVITKLTNSTLIKNFDHAESSIRDLNDTVKPTIMLLFHGTRDTDPSAIYNGYYEGFDMQYAQTGYWGKGMYFAANASYSNKYAHVEGGVSHILMAKVIVGKAFDYGTTHDKTLKHPPLLPGNPVKRYDSVKGNTEGSDVYMIYDGNQAYPTYLLSYREVPA